MCDLQRLRFFLFIVVALFLPGLATRAAPVSTDRTASPNIRFVGPDEVVVPAEAFNCSRSETPDDGSRALDVPDAPPRLIRRGDGQYELISAHHNNIPFYSKDGVKFVRKNCNSILPSGLDADPSHFADQDWITGLVTSNGVDVYALVHDEYHGAAHLPDCIAKLRPNQVYWSPVCLSINMVSFVSHDQGTTFEPLADPLHVAASVPTRLTTDISSIGIRDSSNVVKNPNDGYYYFIARAVTFPPQVGGTCVLRTRDPFREPWLAWNGTDFTARMGSPYAADKKAISTCTPVIDDTYYVASISYNIKLKAFVAMGRSNKRFIFAMSSADMVHWSKPAFLRPSVADNWWKPGNGDPQPDSFYSIIDPSSDSRFFDTSGGSPYLYYVRWRTSADKLLSHQRDIVRTRLEIIP